MSQRWWERRVPSILVFLVVIALAGVVTLSLGLRLKSVLKVVGRDKVGTDPWTDPVGVERTATGFLIAHLPDCAQAPIERIVLWDGNSQPLWEVAGPPAPLGSFVIGAVPPGFTTIHAYRATPSNTVVRERSRLPCRLILLQPMAIARSRTSLTISSCP